MSNTRAMKTGFHAFRTVLLTAALILGGWSLKEGRAEEPENPAATIASPVPVAAAREMARGYDFLAMALAVGLGCIGAGLAVGKVGSAAMGAIVEKPELIGKVLILVGLAEGIAIYGLIFGIMLMKQL